MEKRKVEGETRGREGGREKEVQIIKNFVLISVTHVSRVL